MGYNSACPASHCEKEFLWPMLRETLIYCYKLKYLEGNLTLSFSKIITAGYIPDHNQNSHKITSCGVGFQSNQKAIGCPQNLHAIVVL